MYIRWLSFTVERNRYSFFVTDEQSPTGWKERYNNIVPGGRQPMQLNVIYAKRMAERTMHVVWPALYTAYEQVLL